MNVNMRQDTGTPTAPATKPKGRARTRSKPLDLEAGFDPATDRAAVVEREAFARHREALEDRDALAIGQTRKAWLAACEQLRRMAKDQPSIGKEKGELVEKAVAMGEIIRACLLVKQQMMGLRNLLPTLLAGKEETEISVILEAAIRDACAALTVPKEDERINAFVMDAVERARSTS